MKSAAATAPTGTRLRIGRRQHPHRGESHDQSGLPMNPHGRLPALTSVDMGIVRSNPTQFLEIRRRFRER
ncbi:MAG TPA: hypothetical protein VFG12_04980 [Rhodopila sp.]|jgi:hypothetical protein|nr:hypothetical protein [Rhodopila sp.]